MNIFKTLDRYNKIRTTRRELERLSDRDLADIGITRHDIKWIAGQTK
jgi:uncharacterized protein YjiS (DUF1127 family)